MFNAPSNLDRPGALPFHPLILEPVVGPPIPNISIDPSKPTIIGRASSCQVILADEAISRRHAQVHFTDGGWFITDLGSRHGTHVNAIALESNGATTLHANDLVGLGPWTFRIRTGENTNASHITTDDRLMDAERVERVHERELAAITHNRLNLLMKYAAEIAGVADESKLSKAIVAAAIEGTGFPRAAILRDIGGGATNEVEVICERGPTEPSKSGTPPQGSKFSTSLLKAARSGEIAILTADSPMQGGSIMSLGIRTAMCAPIAIGGTIGTFLYLDARQGESGGARAVAGGFGQQGGVSVQQDAAAFCQALAKMYGLAMGNIKRKELEERQALLERELNAARETQRLIMPPERAMVAGVQYAMRMRSGRYVAGDLFDVVDLDEGVTPAVGESGKVAVFLGDVAGKGIAAAILMATAQTHLNASLRVLKDPAAAVAEVNRYVCSHASKGRFISLWLGVFDPATGDVWYVDAGHGHWLVISERETGSEVRRIDSEGGLLVGVERDYHYKAEHLKLKPGERIVVFSDGIVEQSSPDGAMFGLDGAMHALRTSNGCATDVSGLFDAVTAFAQTDSLQDDTTVASIMFGGAFEAPPPPINSWC